MSFTIYGPAYSVYVRTARLAFEEKRQPYEHVHVDLLEGAHQAADHLARNPHGLVPALDHDGFDLYETDAIVRYVDRILPEPPLVPADPQAEARMNQIIGISESFAYPSIITGLVMQRLVAPRRGAEPDEAVIASAMPRIRLCLREIERLADGAPFLAGDRLSLADLFVAPLFAYLKATPESAGLLAPHVDLQRWWRRMSVRPSMARTDPTPR